MVDLPWHSRSTNAVNKLLVIFYLWSFIIYWYLLERTFVFSGFLYLLSCSTFFSSSNITVIFIGFIGNLSGDASHCFGAWMSVSRLCLQSCFGFFSLEAQSVKILFAMDTCVGISSISCLSVQVGSTSTPKWAASIHGQWYTNLLQCIWDSHTMHLK